MKALDLTLDFMKVVIGGLSGGFVLALYLSAETPNKVKIPLLLLGLILLFLVYYFLAFAIEVRRRRER